MSTADARAALDRQQRGAGVKSRDARSVALDLLDAPRDQRRLWLHTLSETERSYVFGEVARETGTLYGLWHDAPVGFVEDVIGETMWGLQANVMDAIAIPEADRVVVPAGFGVGKTYLAGRMVAWAGAVNPIGTIKIVTTATRLRQVRSQLWPHIKTAVAKGKLPGRTDIMQWMARDTFDNLVQIAYGFSAPPNDEAAMQGIHGTPKLLLVVDEAGGIAQLIGKGTNNLLTGDAKLLAIGNPAMNEPGSWFEGAVKEGEDPEETETLNIRISTLDSPAITGEPTPLCRACVPNLDKHTISEGYKGKSHLPDWRWLRRTLNEYGIQIDRDCRDIDLVRNLCRESGQPYLIAKVLAEFPKDVGHQIIPSSWIEAAAESEEPYDHTSCDHTAGVCTATSLLEGYVRLNELGLLEETADYAVKRGSWIRLGVDVAADGGDEFTIYRIIGDVLHQVHASAGSQNADPNAVADRIIGEIIRAEQLAKAIGTTQPVRVKVDMNGLGWGVVGVLKRWAETNAATSAQVVGVMVAESPAKDDPAAAMRPYRKRDELWLAGRFVMQPTGPGQPGRLRLRVDHRCRVQLGLPQQGYNSQGFVVVESKDSLRKRGLSSPDRAEGALLAIYEPEPINARKRRGIIGGAGYEEST